MALTTTARSACDVSLWLDDATNTLRDISGSSNSVSMELTSNVAEVFAFQTKWPTRIECGKDATISLEILFSEAANEGWDILKEWFFAASPGRRTFRAFFPDKNVGSDRFSCEARIESLSWTATAGEAGPIMVSATLRPDGELTHSDVAT